VHIIDIHMSENALDTRYVIAGQQYLDGVAAGQKQQQLKNAVVITGANLRGELSKWLPKWAPISPMNTTRN